MKIETDEPRLLIVEDRPFAMCGLLCAGLITSIAIVAAGWSGQGVDWDKIAGGLLGLAVCGTGLIATCTWTVFRFDAVSGTLKWRRRGLFSLTQGELPLAEIVSVRVGSWWDTDGKMHRVVLLLRDGSLPMTAHFSGTDNSERMAESIRQWLSTYSAEAGRDA